MATLNNYQNKVAVFLAGQPEDTSVRYYSVDGKPVSIEVTDLNGDG